MSPDWVGLCYLIAPFPLGFCRRHVVATPQFAVDFKNLCYRRYAKSRFAETQSFNFYVIPNGLGITSSFEVSFL